jgi:hypothetical protein
MRSTPTAKPLRDSVPFALALRRRVSAIVRRLKALVMEELPLRDVPQELREEIAKYISDFMIGFVKLRDTDFDQEAELGGPVRWCRLTMFTESLPLITF